MPMNETFPMLALLDGIGGSEMILIFVVVLIFFGGEKLPELARGMGKAMREFKKAASDVEHEFKKAMDEAPDRPASTFLKPAPGAIAQTPPAVTPIVPPAAAPLSPPPENPPPATDHGHGIDV